MKSYKVKKLTLIIILIFIALLSLNACKSNNEQPEETPVSAQPLTQTIDESPIEETPIVTDPIASLETIITDETPPPPEDEPPDSDESGITDPIDTIDKCLDVKNSGQIDHVDKGAGWESVTIIGKAENYSNSYLIELSKDDNKTVYQDSQTGYETWRLTENPNPDDIRREEIPYYNVPVLSPDGKFIVYWQQNCAPVENSNPDCEDYRQWIMKSDGGGEHILGNENDWKTLGADHNDWGSYFGTFSKDGKYYYTGGDHGIFRITLATDKVEKIYNSPFYNPVISPDGTILLGSDVKEDSSCPSNGCMVTFKFFDLIKAEYWDFNMTFEYGIEEDVQRFWIGNDNIFFAYYSVDPIYYSMKYDGVPVPTLFDKKPYLKKRLLLPVLNVNKASKKLTKVGSLNVDDYNDVSGHEEGLFAHITLNDVALKLGNKGMIAGHGHSFEYANSNFNTQDPKERNYAHVFEKNSSPYKADTPFGVHSNFSRDGKSYIVDNSCTPGSIYEYDVAKLNPPKPIVRHTTNESFWQWQTQFKSDPGVSSCVMYDPYVDANSKLKVSPRPQFSPDGTKINYGTFKVPIKNICSENIIVVENQDLYQLIYKKPQTPSGLTLSVINENTKRLKWKPALLHKETKKYEIYWSSSQNEEFVKQSEFTPTMTFLNAESGGLISETETTINVDSTEGFPNTKILLEIEGLHSMQPSEIVRCGGKTPTSFTGCVRGVLGTSPSRHWNDSFIWGEHSIDIKTGTIPNGYLKVKAIEHSGLESVLSDTLGL